MRIKIKTQDDITLPRKKKNNNINFEVYNVFSITTKKHGMIVGIDLLKIYLMNDENPDTEGVRNLRRIAMVTKQKNEIHKETQIWSNEYRSSD